MATKTTTPVPAIARDLSVVQDGSRFADGTGAAFEMALAKIAAPVEEYGPAIDKVDGIVALLTETETAMRRTVLLGDGKTPDLAGGSDLWRKVLDAEQVALYQAALGAAKTRRLRSAITSHREREGLNAANAAAYAVETVNGLGSKTVKVPQADGKPDLSVKIADIVAAAAPGTPIPDAVRAAMGPLYAAQVNKTGKNAGQRKAGFESVPVNFGGPKRQPATTPVEDPQRGLESTWVNLRKGLRERVGSDVAAEQVVRTVTAMLDAYLGLPEKAPTADLIRERSTTADLLDRAAAILGHLANGVRDPEHVNEAKEATQDLRIAG